MKTVVDRLIGGRHKKNRKSGKFRFAVNGDLGEARTLDPLIKSQLLYQLSYQVIVLLGWQRNEKFS